MTKLVVQVYAPDVLKIGGHEKVVRNLSLKLTKRNIKALILHSGVKKRWNKINIIRVPSICLSNRFIFPIKQKNLINELRKASVIHVHCPDNPFAFLSTILAKIIGKPVIVTILCYLGDLYHHRKVMRILSLFTFLMNTIAAILADAIHVENLHDYIYLKKMCGKNKILVYSEPLFSDSLQLKEIFNVKNEEYHKKIKKKKDEIWILFLGRLEKAKGIHMLIKSLNWLDEHFKVIIAGPIQDYKYYNYLKRSVKRNMHKRVFILGPLNNYYKHVMYSLCDVVVIPSLSDIVEAYSLVATEAWYYNKPVVAFPIGALVYRVKNGINGVLAARKTPKCLAEAIKEAVKLNTRNIKCKKPKYYLDCIMIKIYNYLITKSETIKGRKDFD